MELLAVWRYIKPKTKKQIRPQKKSDFSIAEWIYKRKYPKSAQT